MDRTLENLQRLKDRGVNQIKYFHCDHFEPWRLGIKEQYAEETCEFLQQTEKLWFARNLTLFYKPSVSYIYQEANEAREHSVVEGDRIAFLERTEKEIAIARSCMQGIGVSDHEIQLHVHHEGFTLSDIEHDKKVNQWLNSHSNADADASRLDLAIKLHLKAIKQEMDFDLENWLFVHGNWALNGSDHRICRISNEIDILMQNGCVGDMTFPAGRKVVDPKKIKSPYTCAVYNVDRGYDLKEADLRRITDTDFRTADSKRFFVWNSYLTHPFSSIDYHSLTVQKMLLDPDALVCEWLTRSPIFDDSIYVKTHAHSMYHPYWENVAIPLIPHALPAVQKMFELFGNACAKLNMEFNCISAGEVHLELTRFSIQSEAKTLYESDLNDENIQPAKENIDVSIASIDVVNKMIAYSRKKFSDESAYCADRLIAELKNTYADGDIVEVANTLWKSNELENDRHLSVSILEQLVDENSKLVIPYKLGIAHYTGKGTHQDYQVAAEYFSHPSLTYYPSAIYHLGLIYNSEKFIDRCQKRAIEYFTLALHHGDQRAKSHLEKEAA